MNYFKSYFFCLFLLVGFGISAQNSLEKELDHNYRLYNLDRMNTSALYDQFSNKSEFHNITLTFGDETFSLELWDSNLRSEDHTVTLASGATFEGSGPRAMMGNIKGDPSSEVRLTFNDDFIYGSIIRNGKRLTVQPAWYFDHDTDKNVVLSYYSSDIKEHDHGTCGGVHTADNYTIEKIYRDKNKSVGLCFETEIALAADWLMVEDFGGSVSAVDNHICGVLNDVQTDYDDAFPDEILYDLTDTYISDCATCDPWSTSTNAGTVLNSFASWGPNNLSDHDVATLWTGRNFNGSTIGIAFLGAVCFNLRYNVCENFTANGNLLRVVHSHELGHNWDATHDGGGGFIMSASVNNTDEWSDDSIDDIEDFYLGSVCLEDCTDGEPPTAEFEWSIDSECVPSEVEFFDESEGATSWFWTFEGGIPETSTDQFPVVLYADPGLYDVTLEVSNNFGSDTYTVDEAIEVADIPEASFDYFSDDLFIEFLNNTTGGSITDYFWEFGDGNFSDDSDPEHVYDQPGTYTVILEVENACDFSVAVEEIDIYDNPEASFVADTIYACVGDTIGFTDTSYGNISEWEWRFEGGTPERSTLSSPQIRYDSVGVFDVVLEVENPEGRDVITRRAYITVAEPPTSSFTYTNSGQVATFNNTSQGATSFLWNFGDGATSIDSLPVHTYAAPGQYNVVLAASNACTTTLDSQLVNITLLPSAQINTAQSPSGCATHTVAFLDNSGGNPTNWNWTFPGGTPASSTLQNPVVNYSQVGSYSVTLQISNSVGSDVITLPNFVTVDDIPQTEASFVTDLLNVNFTGVANGADNILWDFGDGNTSTVLSPSHTYAEEGSYNVSLTATNQCGSETINLTVVLTLIPQAGFNAVNSVGCADLEVSFLDASSANATSWNWTFPGGTPATSALRNPVVVYEVAGNYDVTLEVSNDAGSDVFTMPSFVQVSDLPSANATFTRNLLDVTFTGTVTDADVVNWDFGDGNTSQLLNPTHSYAQEGVYNVIFTASNQCGSVSSEVTVNVNSFPTAGFTANVTRGCSGLEVSYTDVSSPNTTSWNWTFPGGTPSTSTLQNPVVVYNVPGVYDAELIAFNAEGSNTLIQNNLVEILDLPNASLDFNVIDNRIELTNTTPATTASWVISDGTQFNSQNPIHTFQENGTYTVTLTAINECGSDEVEITVNIDAYPTGSFELAAPAVGCSPYSVQYENTSSMGTAFQWSFPGGTPATSMEENPTVTYNQPGTFDATLIVSNTIGSDQITMSQIVTVFSEPAVNFESTANGAVINFTNTSSDGTSFEWDFGDGNSSVEENPSNRYNESGSYEVTLMVTNECGTAALTRVVIVDFSLPEINVVFSETEGCSPFEVQITDQSTNNPTSWEWEFPGGQPSTSSEQNPVVTYSEPGSYSLSVIVMNADGQSTTDFVDFITVSDIPVALFDIELNGPSIGLTNNSEGADEVLWDFGDGNTSTEDSPTHTYDNPGTYMVTLTVTNICGSTVISEEVVIIPSSTEDLGLGTEWSISPNPTSGEFTLRLESALGNDTEFKVVDLLGRELISQIIVQGQREIVAELDGQGVFLVILQNGNRRDVRRLMVTL